MTWDDCFICSGIVLRFPWITHLSWWSTHLVSQQRKYLADNMASHFRRHSSSKSGSACYHSVQNLLSSSLLSKNVKIEIHRTIIFPVFLYGCETWSPTLRKECRLFSRIGCWGGEFGPKRDEVTGEWRRLHNEELYAVYCSLNITRMIKLIRMRWAGHVAGMDKNLCIHGFSWETWGKETTWKTHA